MPEDADLGEILDTLFTCSYVKCRNQRSFLKKVRIDTNSNLETIIGDFIIRRKSEMPERNRSSSPALAEHRGNTEEIQKEYRNTEGIPNKYRRNTEEIEKEHRPDIRENC